MKKDSADWTIGADWRILHPPYSDLVRELSNNYYPIIHSLIHPQRDTSALSKKNLSKKVRKAAKKVHTKKRK